MRIFSTEAYMRRSLKRCNVPLEQYENTESCFKYLEFQITCVCGFLLYNTTNTQVTKCGITEKDMSSSWNFHRCLWRQFGPYKDISLSNIWYCDVVKKMILWQKIWNYFHMQHYSYKRWRLDLLVKCRYCQACVFTLTVFRNNTRRIFIINLMCSLRNLKR